MSKVIKNIAVVGCGHWGKNLVRNFSELGALACICDPDISLAKSLSAKFNVRSATFDEILQSKDYAAVVLAVPAPLHAKMAIKAMNAGKHVFIEKPLAMNSIEANSMIEASSKNKVHLMVGHLLQYHPVFTSLLDLVENGDMGSISYIYSNRLSLGKIRSEEDVVWSFAPHDISMILSLAGVEPHSVNTESASIIQPGIADCATIHLSFEGSVKAHVSVSWIHPFKEQKLVVIGDQAMAVFDDTQPWDRKLAIYAHTIDTSNITPVPSKASPIYAVIDEEEPLRQECKYFINLVEGSVMPLTDGHEGMRVLRVLEAASRSIEENRAISLSNT